MSIMRTTSAVPAGTETPVLAVAVVAGRVCRPPVVLLGGTPHLLSVHASLPVNSVKELIAYDKGNPGKVNYGSSGTGTTPHLDAELIFKALAKIDITHVPYGPAQAVTAVVGNQVPIASTSMPPAVARELAPRLATPEEVRASKAGKVCLAHTLAVDNIREVVAGEGHFAHRGEQAAVGAIVIREHAVFGSQLAQLLLRQRLCPPRQPPP